MLQECVLLCIKECIFIFAIIKNAGRLPTYTLRLFIIPMHKNKTRQHSAPREFPTLSSGDYTATGNNYFQHIDSGQLIKLCERKKETNKPPLYIMARNESSGKMEFFSSLYGNGSTYTAESSKKYYSVTIAGDMVKVARKGIL